MPETSIRIAIGQDGVDRAGRVRIVEQHRGEPAFHKPSLSFDEGSASSTDVSCHTRHRGIRYRRREAGPALDTLTYRIPSGERPDMDRPQEDPHPATERGSAPLRIVGSLGASAGYQSGHTGPTCRVRAQGLLARSGVPSARRAWRCGWRLFARPRPAGLERAVTR